MWTNVSVSDFRSWHNETIANAALKALKKNFFDAVYFADTGKAAEYIMGFVKSGMAVGFGGSETIKSMGIQDKVKEKGGVILDHNAQGLPDEEKLTIRRKQLTCDLFLTGINAITLDGWLVNVDNTGNRVAAMTFGPQKVIAVAGINKIRKDLNAAFDRIESMASPLNNKRVLRQNPCVTTGTCMDCQSETRICRIYSILKRKPNLTDITVVLVGEPLGF